MVYLHFDIDDIDHVEDANLEWMNLDAGELEDIKCLMEKLISTANVGEHEYRRFGIAEIEVAGCTAAMSVPSSFRMVPNQPLLG